jgi:FdhE protein
MSRSLAKWDWRIERAKELAARHPFAAEALTAWTFLQAYAENIADRADQAGPVETQAALCPLCLPQTPGRRPAATGDGGKRSLICSLCATEWEYRRIVCPACGEEDVNKLPVYVAEELGHVRHARIEACDTCRHCIKTVDLTKDGRAVPVPSACGRRRTGIRS